MCFYADKYSQKYCDRWPRIYGIQKRMEEEAGNRHTVEITAVGSVSLHHASLHHHHPHICKNSAIDPDTGL